MTPQLEKIARAMGESQGVTWNEHRVTYTSTPYLDDGPTADFYRAARAALSALLPPSEEMVEAMAKAIPADGAGFEHCAYAFTAAIQSILSEGEK